MLQKICLEYKRDYQGPHRRDSLLRMSPDGKTQLYSMFEEKLREEMEKEENK
jgi:hypothetical protein